MILVLFAAGHTFGFLSFRPATVEGVAVHDAMSKVSFAVRGRSYTYERFYRGFGLYITAYLLFSALFCWHLPAIAAASPAVAWGFVALQVAGVALSSIYFFPPTVAFSLVVALCVGCTVWLAR